MCTQESEILMFTYTETLQPVTSNLTPFKLNPAHPRQVDALLNKTTLYNHTYTLTYTIKQTVQKSTET